MDTINAIESRRSIRHYDASFKIPKREIEKLIHLAIKSPTSFNIQHWKFLVVEDLELRRKIKEVAMGQDQVTDASCLIIVCADVKAWEKDMTSKWQNVPKDIGSFMANAAHQFYNNNTQLQRDEAIRSAGMATQTILLAATAMGYECGPMVGFSPDEVASLINLPDGYLISNFVVIGRGVKSALPRGGQMGLDQVMNTDKF